MPTSAMITRAMIVLIPGMAVNRSTCSRKGFEPLLKSPIDGCDRTLDRIDLIQMESKQKPMIFRYTATKRRLQFVRRRFQLALELDRAIWSGLAGDDRVENRATRLAQGGPAARAAASSAAQSTCTGRSWLPSRRSLLATTRA